MKLDEDVKVWYYNLLQKLNPVAPEFLYSKSTRTLSSWHIWAGLDTFC